MKVESSTYVLSIFRQLSNVRKNVRINIEMKKKIGLNIIFMKTMIKKKQQNKKKLSVFVLTYIVIIIVLREPENRCEVAPIPAQLLFC